MREDLPADVSAPSDAELMRRLAQGEMVVLATLVQRHQDRIRLLAYRLVGRWDLADDIAQETFLRLYRGANRYEPTAALTTWLHRITVNLCLDWSKRRRIGLWSQSDQLIASDPPASDTLVREEKLAAIREAVNDLPERQRVALILHRFENLNHTEITAVTGWSRSAVESLLVRAYARLRRQLKDWLNE